MLCSFIPAAVFALEFFLIIAPLLVVDSADPSDSEPEIV